MTRAFAFLRGINVGNRRPKKDALIAAVAGPGLDDVSTYQASGNLSFTTEVESAELETMLEARLETALGYGVICFVRTLDELVRLVDELPPLSDDEKHQVIFYKSDPGAEVRSALDATAGPDDTLRARERETIWTHAGGMLDSPLQIMSPPAGWPVTTVRTAGTIERLVTKFASPS